MDSYRASIYGTVDTAETQLLDFDGGANPYRKDRSLMNRMHKL
jgi:hypothetical protein